MPDESWIVDQETLDHAKEEALGAIDAMQGYKELALSDEQRQDLITIEGEHRVRISLIDGMLSAMGALMAHGFPEAVDTSGLAPFQHMLEQAHAEEGERLQEMASHLDLSQEAPPQMPDPPKAPQASFEPDYPEDTRLSSESERPKPSTEDKED